MFEYNTKYSNSNIELNIKYLRYLFINEDDVQRAANNIFVK